MACLLKMDFYHCKMNVASMLPFVLGHSNVKNVAPRSNKTET